MSDPVSQKKTLKPVFGTTSKCQVCFPGGMREETDCSAVETALRECEEEIQLQRDVVKVTSVLPSLK